MKTRIKLPRGFEFEKRIHPDILDGRVVVYGKADCPDTFLRMYVYPFVYYSPKGIYDSNISNLVQVNNLKGSVRANDLFLPGCVSTPELFGLFNSDLIYCSKSFSIENNLDLHKVWRDLAKVIVENYKPVYQKQRDDGKLIFCQGVVY